MELPQAAEISIPRGAPDWQKQREEIHCPMCEYNLRGLTEPRCPECGYRFEWKDLLDARTRPHPYLFEHHPEANFKSFWKTAWGGLRPWKFWTALRPTHALRARRLLLYWGIVSFSLALMFLADGIHNAVTQWQWLKVNHAWALANPSALRFNVPPPPAPILPQFRAYVDSIYPPPTIRRVVASAWGQIGQFPGQVFIVLCGAAAAWPLLTFALLMIFRASILKSGVGFGHLLRVLIYSADPSLWMALILIGYAGCSLVAGLLIWPQSNNTTSAAHYWWYRDSLNLVQWLFIAQILTFFVRVGISRAKYLRVRQATPMLVLSQMILLLALGIIVCNIDGLVQWWWRIASLRW